MAIQLPPLPYKLDALEPHMSKQTLHYHYEKHHKAYVDKTNELISDTIYDKMSLKEIVLESHWKNEKIFHNSAQAWNHAFFWQCLSPSGGKPSKTVRQELEDSFGSFDGFKKEFSNQAAELFGSGWTWLVRNPDESLAIAPMDNADNPLMHGQFALMTVDVWEHAYYLDHQNQRPNYLENFWRLVNWDFVEMNLERSRERTWKGAVASSKDMRPLTH